MGLRVRIYGFGDSHIWVLAFGGSVESLIRTFIIFILGGVVFIFFFFWSIAIDYFFLNVY